MPGGVYTGGGAIVVMDPPPVVYVKVFHPFSGPERNLRRRADNVAMTAKVLAPRRSGALAASVRVDQNRDEKGRYAFGFAVSANTPYAYYVHEGTDPHVYFSYPGKMRFPGTKSFFGEEIFTDMIDHPGNSAQPFLQNALSAMAVGTW